MRRARWAACALSYSLACLGQPKHIRNYTYKYSIEMQLAALNGMEMAKYAIEWACNHPGLQLNVNCDANSLILKTGIHTFVVHILDDVRFAWGHISSWINSQTVQWQRKWDRESNFNRPSCYVRKCDDCLHSHVAVSVFLSSFRLCFSLAKRSDGK